MMARGHVLSGVTVGLATAHLLPDLGIHTGTSWVLLVAGGSLLPDLDSPRSTVSRMWGPITGGPHRAVLTRVLGGHRGGSHQLWFQVLVGVLLWVLGSWAPGTAVVLALGTGLVLSGLGVLVPGKQSWERSWVWGLVLAALIGTGLAAVLGWVLPWWVPVGLVLGQVTHIVGDGLTKAGVGLGWPLQKIRLRLLPIKAGGLVETRVLYPAFVLASVLLTLGYGGLGPGTLLVGRG